MKTENLFVVMWCEDGFETIVPIDMDIINEERDQIFIEKLSEDSNILENSDNPIKDIDKYTRERSQIIQRLILRARYNSQRNYEIYSLKTSLDITEKDIRSCFDDNPQMIVNLIREKGVRLFGTGRGQQRTTIY